MNTKNRKAYFVLLALNIIVSVCLSSVATSCIKDDDDTPQQPQKNDSIVVVIDSTKVVVDSTFQATIEYLSGEWMAEYVGYDPMQDANSAIRRLFYFSPDGTYDSHVQGINSLQSDTVATYKEFEHEHGKYSFDVEKQLLTYSVEYDSLLNFFTDQLEYNSGKVMQGVGILKEYNENVWFSLEKEGKRDWIRVDDNLRTLDDHSSKLLYIMKNQ